MLRHRRIGPIVLAFAAGWTGLALHLAACEPSPSDAEVDAAIRDKCAHAAACDVLGSGEDEESCVETRHDLYDALDRDCRPAQVRLWRCLSELSCTMLANTYVRDTRCVDAYDDVVDAGCIPDVCLPTAP
ncbi:MAG: hypothetical protein D6705_05865 [Deltaproteobacteria bacterium]|nr:MAG: hypothetical protein D6705_05865 [Deltaproteobacteria bacterium]